MSDLPFKLWLEFELYMSEDGYDPTTDFFNMCIIFPTGKKYALNVWTYNFFIEVFHKEKKLDSSIQGRYNHAPDLFIEYCDRKLIEAIVSDIINKKELSDNWLVPLD